MKIFLPLLFYVSIPGTAFCQLGPEITSWIINTDNSTGYGGILSNVQLVQYSVDNVYVSCTCIPGYDIGPWTNNPNLPANQNFVYKITRHPIQNTGTPVQTPNGHIGVWTNGVSIFNAKDAHSFNNQNIWNQNAVIVEGISFDSCLGHPAPNGEYHHHLNPRCLYDDHDSSIHSPIIGYAFDGFPIYGAYGNKYTDGTGGITRMRSSYQLRSITDRTTLPDGTVLNSSQYGPAVSVTYPLGYYIEDFEYVPGSGDLDEHNGRFCITPEYPSGIYAYFITLDETGAAAYPYTLGPVYYGTVPAGNTGPGSGHNTITESVTSYDPTIGISEENEIQFNLFPNPTYDKVYITLSAISSNDVKGILFNAGGQIIKTFYYLQPTITYTLDFTGVCPGIYFLKLENGHSSVAQVIIRN